MNNPQSLIFNRWDQVHHHYSIGRITAHFFIALGGFTAGFWLWTHSWFEEADIVLFMSYLPLDTSATSL